MSRALLTRPRAQSEALARELSDRGWAADIWPLTDIQTTLTEAPDWTDARGCLFTSANAVRAIAALPHPEIPAFCVGSATAKAAHKAGFRPIENAAGDAASLAALVSTRLTPDGGPLIHIRGRDIAGDLGAILTEAGFDLREVIAYQAVETGPPPAAIADALRKGAYDAVTFFSPRASNIFCNVADPAWKPGLRLTTAVAISTAAARPLEMVGFRGIIISETPSGLSMKSAICSVART
ncbi:MAG: uroporphyrinogen-III synthase [Pseudomonadota bacterium]